MKDLLTVADLAHRFGVAKATARRWCEQGLFPHAEQIARIGRGGIWLVPESDLAGFERPKVGRRRKPGSRRPRRERGEDPWGHLEPSPWEPARKVLPRPGR